MNKKGYQTGFTITELMVTLAVAAILLGVGVPGMQVAAQNARIVSAHNTLTGSLQLARSEAIKRRQSVSVCARGNDDATCGTDWRNGWLVFTDQGANRGTIDNDETILAVSPGIVPSVRLANRAKLASGSGGIAARPFIRFSGRGTSSWRGGGSFVLCDQRNEKSLTALNVVITGDIRKARKSGNNVINAFGTNAQCPPEVPDVT